jgi:hypothetical protein
MYSAETTQLTIDLAANYLLANIQSNGQFVYRRNTNPKIKIKPKYNILRHAGTIYALCSYQQLFPHRDTPAAIQRAGEFLVENAIAPLPEAPDILAVWSDPDINGSDRPPQAKLGGTGLGLVALAQIQRMQPEWISIAKLQQLGQFLTYMQKEDGGFAAKYVPSQGGIRDDWQSLYYLGEAALGLLELYQQDPQEVWLQAALDSLTYLARSRQGKKQVPADHWALLATEKLFSLTTEEQRSGSSNLLTNHARQICQQILRHLPEQQVIEDWGLMRDVSTSLNASGRTTPTATRLEGLLAAWSFLPESAMGELMEAAIRAGMVFLQRSQIREGPFAGGIPRAIAPLSSTHHSDDARKSIQKFNRRATEVRIDYVQHTLSATIQYFRLFCRPGSHSLERRDNRQLW